MVDILENTESRIDVNKLAEEVYGFIKQKSDPREAREDANIILLMGSNDHETAAKKANELWKEDKTRIIVTTPKKGRFSPESTNEISEADDYNNILLRLKSEEKDGTKITIIHDPISENTIEELEALIPELEKEGVVAKSILLVDIPVHQKRAYLNAKKLLPDLKFVNCPANSEFDITVPENQCRLVEEVERLTVYKDLVRPYISREMLETTAKLRRHLINTGVYKKSEHHPRSLYEHKVPNRFYKHGERAGEWDES